jgi:ribose transport system substrate-binding protein
MAMEAYSRRKSILALLKETGEVRIDNLVRRFGVSANTIRADLTAMEEAGLTRRIRGGAVVEDQPRGGSHIDALISPSIPNRLQKEQIACWAAGLVKDGEAIIVDASSTVLQMAVCLDKRRNLTVVTNGLGVAQLLAREPTNKIILAAPVLRADGNALVGSIHPDLLTSLRAAKCFFSCSGISPKEGLTEVDVDEAALKAQMLKLARQVVVLADHTKFDRTGAFKFASLTQIHHLVTDEAVSAEHLAALRRIANFPITITGTLSAQTLAPMTMAANGQRYRIGFANMTEGMQFCRQVREGLEKEAQRLGNIDLLIRNNDLDHQKALENADWFVSNHVQLIIEFQIHSRAGNVIMDKFNRAGIPVIAVDIPMPGATYFGADNYRAGFIAGQGLGRWIQQQWQQPPDLVLCLQARQVGPAAEARLQGEREGLEAAIGPLPDERVITIETPVIMEEAETMMQEQVAAISPGTRVAILAINDDAALGALTAFEKASRLDRVAAVGQNADLVGRAALGRPDLPFVGSTSYTPERYGEQLLELACRILDGEPVPPAAFCRHTFITRDNIHDYYPDSGERMILP